MMRFTQKGDWKEFRDWAAKIKRKQYMKKLDKFGEMGVTALSKATPRDTGKTAQSWRYRITNKGGSPTIEWYNTHAPYGTAVAVLIQYGHGTGTGGYVQGRDYINPSMRPVFDRIAQDFFKEVTSWQ